MAPKTKKTIPPPHNTLKKGGKVKTRRKSLPPPQLHTSESEELGLDEEEPSLRDVIKMLGDSTRVDTLSAHVVVPRPAPDTQPSSSHLSAEGSLPLTATVDDDDQFHGMEEQVHLRISQHLNATHPGYLPTTDEDSEGEQ